jgi:hypothetical protein
MIAGDVVSIIDRADGRVVDGLLVSWNGDPRSFAVIVTPDARRYRRVPAECIPAGERRIYGSSSVVPDAADTGTVRIDGAPPLTDMEQLEIRAAVVQVLAQNLMPARHEPRIHTPEEPALDRADRIRHGRGEIPHFPIPDRVAIPRAGSRLTKAMTTYIAEHPQFRQALLELERDYPDYAAVIKEHLRPSGPPLKDIAARLGISYANARYRKSQGMKKLRRRLPSHMFA